jgi:hypothetical protein
MLNQTDLDLILGALKRKSLSIVCVGAIGTGSRITRQSLQKKKDSDLHSVRSPPKEKVDKQVGMIKRIPSSVRRQSGKDQRPLLLAKEQVRRSAVRARGCERLVRVSPAATWLPMYSELKLNTPELQELARQKLYQAVKDHPNLSVQARWNKVKKENPDLFTKLQEADDKASAEAKERDRQEAHPAFKVQSGLKPPTKKGSSV